VIGWIAAALPALGFLVMVKIALGGTASSGGTWAAASAHDSAGSPSPSSGSTSGIAAPDGGDRPARVPPGGDDLRPRDSRSPSGDDDLAEKTRDKTTGAAQSPQAEGRVAVDVVADLPAARRARDSLISEGRPVTRDALAERLRRDGYPVWNARMSVLLGILRREAANGRDGAAD
jgi:hypothetical protein